MEVIALSQILAGDPGRIAIESRIDEFLDSESQLGLGYFLIHAGGHRFGVKDVRASALGSSYAAVLRRIADRGKHTLSFSGQVGATEIASAVVNTVYDRGFAAAALSSERIGELDAALYANDLIWAPDGDEAFDDGSHVLQIDEGEEARIIAFINDATEELTVNTIVDVRVPGDEFYEVLTLWSHGFEQQWKNANPGSA